MSSRAAARNAKKPKNRHALVLSGKNAFDQGDFAVDEDDYLVASEILLSTTDVPDEERKARARAILDLQKKVVGRSVDNRLSVSSLFATIEQMETLTNKIKTKANEIVKMQEKVSKQSIETLQVPPTLEIDSISAPIEPLQDLLLALDCMMVEKKAREMVETEENDTERRIRKLQLSSSKIISLPNSIGQLSKLQHLHLPTSVMKLPAEIGNLTGLIRLDLCKLQITCLPPSIGRLTNLQELDVSGTKLSRVRQQIGNLVNLRVLNLSKSKIKSLPACVGKLKNLQVLVLRQMEKLSELPKEIGDLASLSKLDLYGTKISSLPSSIGELQHLRELELCNSNIGSLPSSIGKLQNLKEMDLSDNSYGGWGISTNLFQLPDEIGNLNNMFKLNLNGCDNLSSLPASIGRLRNLQDLTLSRTKSLSKLPEEIGNLTSLSKLNLSKSGIKELPSSIGHLKNLQDLKLCNSSLGQLPEEIGNLSSLKKLNLYNCSSISSLPTSIGCLQNLEDLDMTSAVSLFQLPEEIGNLHSLRKLNLAGSSITSLPSTIGQLKNLSSLNISLTRQLSELPDSLAKLKGLRSLDVSHSPIEKMDNVLLRFAQSNPWLGYLGRCSFSKNSKLYYTLACNRAKFRTKDSMQMMPKLWCLLIHNAKRPFGRYENAAYSQSDIIDKRDAIYRLLLDCRESFLVFLLDALRGATTH